MLNSDKCKDIRFQLVNIIPFDQTEMNKTMKLKRYINEHNETFISFDWIRQSRYFALNPKSRTLLTDDKISLLHNDVVDRINHYVSKGILNNVVASKVLQSKRNVQFMSQGQMSGGVLPTSIPTQPTVITNRPSTIQLNPSHITQQSNLTNTLNHPLQPNTMGLQMNRSNVLGNPTYSPLQSVNIGPITPMNKSTNIRNLIVNSSSGVNNFKTISKYDPNSTRLLTYQDLFEVTKQMALITLNNGKDSDPFTMELENSLRKKLITEIMILRDSVSDKIPIEENMLKNMSINELKRILSMCEDECNCQNLITCGATVLDLIGKGCDMFYPNGFTVGSNNITLNSSAFVTGIKNAFLNTNNSTSVTFSRFVRRNKIRIPDEATLTVVGIGETIKNIKVTSTENVTN